MKITTSATLFVLVSAALLSGCQAEVIEKQSTPEPGVSLNINADSDKGSLKFKASGEDGSKVSIDAGGDKGAFKFDAKGGDGNVSINADEKGGKLEIKADGKEGKFENNVDFSEAEFGAPFFPGSEPVKVATMRFSSVKEDNLLSVRTTPEKPAEVRKFYEGKARETATTWNQSADAEHWTLTGRLPSGKEFSVEAKWEKGDKVTTISAAVTTRK